MKQVTDMITNVMPKVEKYGSDYGICLYLTRDEIIIIIFEVIIKGLLDERVKKAWGGQLLFICLTTIETNIVRN